MKPRIKKLAPGLWQCASPAITVEGWTPSLAYKEWDYWIHMNELWPQRFSLGDLMNSRPVGIVRIVKNV